MTPSSPLTRLVAAVMSLATLIAMMSGCAQAAAENGPSPAMSAAASTAAALGPTQAKPSASSSSTPDNFFTGGQYQPPSATPSLYSGSGAQASISIAGPASGGSGTPQVEAAPAGAPGSAPTPDQVGAGGQARAELIKIWTPEIAKPQTQEELVASAAEGMDILLAKLPGRVQYRPDLNRVIVTFPSGDRVEWAIDAGQTAVDLTIVTNVDVLMRYGLHPAAMGPDWTYQPAQVGADGSELSPPLVIQSVNLTDETAVMGKKENAATALQRLLKAAPGKMDLNSDLGVFTLQLPNGTKMQWSRQSGQSDIDARFVFLAAPFTGAGLDVEIMEKTKWLYLALGFSTTPLLVKPLRVR